MAIPTANPSSFARMPPSAQTKLSAAVKTLCGGVRIPANGVPFVKGAKGLDVLLLSQGGLERFLFNAAYVCQKQTRIKYSLHREPGMKAWWR